MVWRMLSTLVQVGTDAGAAGGLNGGVAACNVQGSGNVGKAKATWVQVTGVFLLHLELYSTSIYICTATTLKQPLDGLLMITTSKSWGKLPFYSVASNRTTRKLLFMQSSL